jgi:putative CocE/NonD family hydrolase
MNIVVENGVPVPAADGTRLATDVYRPDSGRWPVLLIRLPYGRQGKGTAVNGFDVLRAVRAGYVVVTQDTRGRFDSDGVFDPFVDEAGDGAEAVRWAASQPWSTGKVGMIGGSYMGVTQWTTATRNPPALRALVPVVTPPDYHDGWAYTGGAFQLGLCLWWTLHSLAPNELQRRIRRGVPGAGDALRQILAACDQPEVVFEHLPLRGLDLFGDVAPYYDEWLAHPTRDEFWRARSPLDDFDRIAAPAMIVGGWFDCFLPGTLRSWSALADSQPTASRHRRLVIGPWAHGAGTGTFPERSFGVMAGNDGAIDLPGLQLQWFDWHLKGQVPTLDIDRPVSIFVMGPDEWRHESDWPLPGTHYTDWYLGSSGRANTVHGDGTLSPLPISDSAGEDAFRYDPLRPVPTHGGGSFLPGGYIAANAGPRDQRVIEERDDVLCYTSEPLNSALTIIGPVQAELYVSTSTRDTDFTAKLVDVHPDGRAMSVTDGILRLRYRDNGNGNGNAPTLAEPGEVYAITIDLAATAIVLPAGHRLRLEVSSSNFPRFDRNTNSGGVIAEETEPDLRVAVNRIHHRGRQPSRLVLPVQPD